MGTRTNIAWCHRTFNAWLGCAKVSEACQNCYAERSQPVAMNRERWGIEWGEHGGRHITSDAGWAAPLRWNREAERDGVRIRVFCSSLADVFEDRRDLDKHRARLFALIERTPDLDWLLVTKRIDRVVDLVPPSWNTAWPENAWLGTTIENQARADERLPHLLRHAAPVRFVSVEPQLGPVDLSAYIEGVDWVISGGESGAGRRVRPTQLAWTRALRDQCVGANVAFFHKQWGAYQPNAEGLMERLGGHGYDPILDGQRWEQFPIARRPAAVRVAPRRGPGTARSRAPRVALPIVG